MLPGYPGALEKVKEKRVDAQFRNVMGIRDVHLISGRMPDTGLPVWLVDAPILYEREGSPYQDPAGQDWPDNAERFALLCHVAALVARGNAGIEWLPDVVHANDWHTGLLPLLLAMPRSRPATLFTIHNMAFQGVFSSEVMGRLNLPSATDRSSLEYYGQISFLKAGIAHGDRLTTVSPTYAKQVLLPEYGFGLEDLLHVRRKDLAGILNGADYGIWDPSRDKHLPVTFKLGRIAGKSACKERLQEELGLAAVPDVPLVAFVSRLTDQKMADIVLGLLSTFLDRDMQFVLHGQGDRRLEQGFREAAEAQPEKVAVRIGYDEATAHRVLGGADILLAPARFEPCGLTQLYAMRYGTVPIVRHTGGLADTVANMDLRSPNVGTATGFVFEEPTAQDLMECLDRALSLYAQPLAWHRLRCHAMKQDLGWGVSAEQYFSLYKELAGDRTSPFEASKATAMSGRIVA